MPDEVPTIYSDGLSVSSNPFTISLTFTVSPTPGSGNQPPKLVADIRMSPEHAKVMAIVLRKQLREFEAQQGRPIPVHPHVAQGLGLSPNEDW